MIRIGIIFLILGAFSLIGCQHMLYYPSRTRYINPEKLKYTPEEISVNSSHGQKLVAWHFKSNKEGSLSRPIILFFHGNAQNLSSHFMSLYWILEEGFDFLIFDYPGYGGSEGSPTPKSTVESGLLFWKHIKNQFPNRKVAIFGQSLGGAVALKVATLIHAESELCLVAVDSSFASYQRVAQKVLARNWVTWPIQWLAYLLLSDSESPDGKISEISPIPILVIHGKKDQVVEYELGKEIYEQAKDPKYFWSVENGGHIESFANLEYGNKLKANFKKHLSLHCSLEKD